MITIEIQDIEDVITLIEMLEEMQLYFREGDCCSTSEDE